MNEDLIRNIFEEKSNGYKTLDNSILNEDYVNDNLSESSKSPNNNPTPKTNKKQKIN